MVAACPKLVVSTGYPTFFCHTPTSVQSKLLVQGFCCKWIKLICRGTAKHTEWCVLTEDSNEPVHPLGLIWVFAEYTVDGNDPKLLHVDSEDWSDWVGALTDLSLCCRPKWFCRFFLPQHETFWISYCMIFMFYRFDDIVAHLVHQSATWQCPLCPRCSLSTSRSSIYLLCLRINVTLELSPLTTLWPTSFTSLRPDSVRYVLGVHYRRPGPPSISSASGSTTSSYLLCEN